MFITKLISCVRLNLFALDISYIKSTLILLLYNIQLKFNKQDIENTNEKTFSGNSEFRLNSVIRETLC